MASPADELPDNGATVLAGGQNATFRLRSYQTEMVEESLRRNIIVAMDTGSGKTHIALSRTAAELETCLPDQIIWFLAPTVALCIQQLHVFQSNLPGYGITLLCGADGVDNWSDQSTWDAVLTNVRVVLSTHQVLLDALTHGFVRMSKLALLIFDEAHHCVSKHAGNQIMTNFYRPASLGRNSSHFPRILGLSASPVMKAKANGASLRKIEQNLDSITRSPKIHRSELIRFVHKPQLVKVTYPLGNTNNQHSRLLACLQRIYGDYDLETDPYLLGLYAQQSAGYDCSKSIEKVHLRERTYCKDQLKNLVTKAEAVFQELGPSPTDWYLHQCINKYVAQTSNSDQQMLGSSSEEKDHLSKLFRSLSGLEFGEDTQMSLENISLKVESLVDVLVSEAGAEFTGLVFVEQRAWVVILEVILSTHPRTKSIFNVGTFVGTSNSSKRMGDISDLSEPRKQEVTLDEFRAGQKNLILATTVLEEGIDVSSCHLVICFERPKNLKSFIQRRGRARKQESKYIIFVPEPDPSSTTQPRHAPELWETLEEEMKAAYLNDLREIEKASEREEEEEGEILCHQIPSTGALLTSDNASQHLYHFCATLTSGAYVDSRPEFTFNEDEDGNITAHVILPLSVNPALRNFSSSDSWRTEKMARKDAAFQAYKALHEAGLINDNLLPDRQDDEAAEFQKSDGTPAMIEVSSLFDPWVDVARQQQQNPRLYHPVLIRVISPAPGDEPVSMVFFAPCRLPEIPEFTLYWNETKCFSVRSSHLSETLLNDEELATMQSVTRKMLYSVFQSRMQQTRQDFLWLLMPSTFDKKSLEHWDANMEGEVPAMDILDKPSAEWGIVNVRGDLRKYMLQSISKVDAQLKVIRAPRRRDFLHKVVEQGSSPNNAYTTVQSLDAADCVVSNLPAVYSTFALFTPSIIYKYETFMIAEALRTTVLEPISFGKSETSLLLQAITSSTAGEEDNYQRLEFLGDCILKHITSTHLMASHLMWTESYLTGKKGKLVSNGTLARATLAAGLDKFIITKSFTGLKWAPRYANDILTNDQAAEKPQLRSSKLLADVIESLIGASYLVGGLPKAFTCINTLLPLEPWTPLPAANAQLFHAAPTLDFEPTNLKVLEDLIGYTFTKKVLLLEALTHGSYKGPFANICSYERSEFLGDAVLDFIVSTRLYDHSPELSHQKMHSIRTAMVNGPFLAFCMFETTVLEKRVDKLTKEHETVERALWQFLRHGSVHLIAIREVALKQHRENRNLIKDALKSDKKYPWHLLSLNDAPKLLSDIVESVIGGIYIDSCGDMAACEVFLRKLGVLDQLERILRDEVDCLHPKERLGHLAVERTVKYVKLGNEEGEGEGNGKTGYRVQVELEGVEIGGPVEGVKRLNAETIAAFKAVEILEQRGVKIDEKSEDEVWFTADDGSGVLELEVTEENEDKEEIVEEVVVRGRVAVKRVALDPQGGDADATIPHREKILKKA